MSHTISKIPSSKDTLTSSYLLLQTPDFATNRTWLRLETKMDAFCKRGQCGLGHNIMLPALARSFTWMYTQHHAVRPWSAHGAHRALYQPYESPHHNVIVFLFWRKCTACMFANFHSISCKFLCSLMYCCANLTLKVTVASAIVSVQLHMCTSR
jgi:hypothetical protein